MTALLCLWLAVAHAADPVADAPATDLQVAAELGPPGPPPAAADRDTIARNIALGLRCPVCQGLSIAESPSPTAREMNDRVKDLVGQGYDAEQIRAYFVARYGEWVLLAPPLSDNALVWLGPGVLAGGGLVVVLLTAMSWRKTPEKLPSDEGLVPKDEYERRLLKELDDT